MVATWKRWSFYHERLRTKDYFYYYQTLKSSFVTDQKNFDPSKRPDPAESKNWGDWSNFAEALLVEKDLERIALNIKKHIQWRLWWK
jgi:hypothetical protein